MPQTAQPIASLAGLDPATAVARAPNITSLTVTDALGYYQDVCEITFEVPLDDPANGLLNVAHVRELPRLMSIIPVVTGGVGDVVFGTYYVRRAGGTKRYDHIEITLGGNRFQATAATEAKLRASLSGQLAAWAGRGVFRGASAADPAGYIAGVVEEQRNLSGMVSTLREFGFAVLSAVGSNPTLRHFRSFYDAGLGELSGGALDVSDRELEFNLPDNRVRQANSLFDPSTISAYINTSTANETDTLVGLGGAAVPETGPLEPRVTLSGNFENQAAADLRILGAAEQRAFAAEAATVVIDLNPSVKPGQRLRHTGLDLTVITATHDLTSFNTRCECVPTRGTGDLGDIL